LLPGQSKKIESLISVYVINNPLNTSNALKQNQQILPLVSKREQFNLQLRKFGS
jgi:hypothetical protein